jgi:hypothetical protein
VSVASDSRSEPARIWLECPERPIRRPSIALRFADLDDLATHVMTTGGTNHMGRQHGAAFGTNRQLAWSLRVMGTTLSCARIGVFAFGNGHLNTSKQVPNQPQPVFRQLLSCPRQVAHPRSRPRPCQADGTRVEAELRGGGCRAGEQPLGTRLHPRRQARQHGWISGGSGLPRHLQQAADPVAIGFQRRDPLSQAGITRNRDLVDPLGRAALRRVPCRSNQPLLFLRTAVFRVVRGSGADRHWA